MAGRETRKKKRVVPILCRIVGIIFLLAVIVTAVPFVIPKFKDLQVYQMENSSMEPELPAGSLIYVESCDPQSLVEGDIITFERDGVYVTHRVVENYVFQGQLLTKGDADEEIDTYPVPHESIVGKVTSHIPILGKFLAIYSSTIGKIYVFLVAACGVMLLVLGSMLKRS